MALQEQIVPVSFARGLDTKTDPKQLQLGSMLLLQNAVFNSPGRYKKRFGQKALTSAGLTGQGLAAYRDELVTWDGEKLYSLVGSSDTQELKGRAYSPDVRVPQVIRNGYNQSNVDGAATTSTRVYAWEDSRGGVWYGAIDVESGQLLYEVQADANGQKPRVVSLGQYLVVIWRNTVDHKIYRLGVPATNPNTPGTATAFVTDLNVAAPYYAVVSDGSKMFIAYNATAATTLNISYLDRTLAVVGPVALAGVTINQAIDVSFFQQLYISVSWYDGADVKLRFFSYVDMSTTGGLVTVETVANVLNVATVSRSAADLQVLYTATAASSINYKVRSNTYINSILGTPVNHFLSVSMTGKPFMLDGLVMVPCTFSSSLQTTNFILSRGPAFEFITVARMLSGLAGTPRTDYVLTQTMNDGTSWHMAMTQRDLLTTIVDTTGTNPNNNSGGGTVVYTQSGVSAMLMQMFNQQTSFSHAEMAATLLVAGGAMNLYDGSTVTEHGFSVYPEGATVTVTSNSGTALSAGVYFYAYTYEWTDEQGRLHRSAPTLPVSVTTIANDHTTSVVPTLRLTNKIGVQVVAWRTEVNGTVFYRLGQPSAPTLNVPTSDSVSILDGAPDSAIIGGPKLYTLGGVIENEPAPPCTSLVTWNGRIAYLPTEGDGNSWGISKIVSVGAPVEFTTFFINPCDPRGGPIRALGAMDEKLVLFKESSIFIQTGQGPDDTGAQNDLGPSPQLLTVDVGCTNQRSVVITPLGLLFKSSKGIYMLSRSLSTTYVGGPVEAFNDREVISAVLLADRNQVRFGLDDGTALVYDYFVGQWSVFTDHSQVDAVNYQTLYTLLRSDGGIRQEDPTTFLDLGLFYSMKARTSWIQLAGLQGYQRVWKVDVLGEYASPHTLRVGISMDFNPAVTQTEQVPVTAPGTWGSDASWGSGLVWGGPFPIYQFQINMKQQKCQAIAVTVEDLAGSGESMSLSGLSLVVGVKPNAMRIPASRRFGHPAD